MNPNLHSTARQKISESRNTTFITFSMKAFVNLSLLRLNTLNMFIKSITLSRGASNTTYCYMFTKQTQSNSATNDCKLQMFAFTRKTKASSVQRIAVEHLQVTSTYKYTHQSIDKKSTHCTQARDS